MVPMEALGQKVPQKGGLAGLTWEDLAWEGMEGRLAVMGVLQGWAQALLAPQAGVMVVHQGVMA